MLFGYIKEDDAPEFIPTLRFFNFESKKLPERGLALSLWRQNKGDRSIRILSIGDQLLGIEES